MPVIAFIQFCTYSVLYRLVGRLGLGLAVIQYYLAFALKLFYYVFFDLYLTSGVCNISQTSVIRDHSWSLWVGTF